MRPSPSIAFAAGVLLMAGGAAASEHDGPMATAGGGMSAPPSANAGPVASATPARPLTTAEQIEQFLAAAPSADEPAEPLVPMERKIRGEVAVGVGTHGYRSIYARTDIPVGKTGTVSIAAEKTEGRGLYGRCAGALHDEWLSPADPHGIGCGPYPAGPRALRR